MPAVAPPLSRTFASTTTVHPTALVHPAASLGAHVDIGPYAIVEADVRIGDRTQILASAYVAAGTDIGPDCEIHMGAILGHTPQIRGFRGPTGGLIIGRRNVIREYSVIESGQRPGRATVLGSDNYLLGRCNVGHDCQIGDGVTIASGALLAGCVTLGDGVFVSGNAGIHQHVKVGALSMIAGQARVTKDVLPFVLVAGNSNVRGLNVVGMRRAGMTAAQRQHVRRAYTILFRSGLNVSQAVARLRDAAANDEVRVWLEFIAASTRGLCASRRSSRPWPTSS